MGQETSTITKKKPDAIQLAMALFRPYLVPWLLLNVVYLPLLCFHIASIRSMYLAGSVSGKEATVDSLILLAAYLLPWCVLLGSSTFFRVVQNSWPAYLALYLAQILLCVAIIAPFPLAIFMPFSNADMGFTDSIPISYSEAMSRCLASIAKGVFFAHLFIFPWTFRIIRRAILKEIDRTPTI